MAVRISILGSGSTGNCTLVSTSQTTLMIDAGFSRREILKRMHAVGECIERVSAVILSHEHSDHVAGVPILARRHQLPVYLNRMTLRALGAEGNKLERLEYFSAGQTFAIGDIEITPFTIPHDAADPVAFTFRAEGVKIALVTDLGYIPENVKHHVAGCACLVLESNHDLDMLKVGPYPWSLKQRVMSRVGHLSNDSVAGFLGMDFDGSAANIVLAHLSEYNNIPELARISAEQALAARALAPKLQIARQDVPLEPIVF